jgi:hypothetical protein
MKEINLGFWDNLRNGIRNHLNNENIVNFQNWYEIRTTMIADVNNVEYEYLITENRWEIWKDKLKEFVLKPNNHSIYSESSTNNLHHAYSLQILIENTGYRLNEFDDIVEFGGGYGNVCRLFNVWGHNKSYYLYDIPELIQIQKYYLEKNNCLDNISYKTGFDVIDTVNGNSLFLGMWSLSEVPISERAVLLENLKFFDCNNIFLAMGGMFQNENNINWLNNIIIPKLKTLNHEIKLIKIKHFADMFYFISTKNI